MKLKLLILILISFVYTVQSKEIFKSNFLNDDNLKQWKIMKYTKGEKTGEAMPGRMVNKQRPMILLSPDNKSWGFVEKTFSGTELPKGEKIRLTVYLQTNNCKNVDLIISDGVSWGGDVKRYSKRHPKENFAWEKVVAIFDRSDTNNLISVAIGLDYRTEGTWVAIDTVVVECADKFTENTEKDSLPDYKVWLESKKIATWVLPKINKCSEDLKTYFGADENAMKAFNGELQNLNRIKSIIQNEEYICAQETKYVFSSEQLGFLWKICNSLTFFNENTILTPENQTIYEMNAAQNAQEMCIIMLRNNFDSINRFKVSLSGNIAKNTKLYSMEYIDKSPDCIRPMTNDSFITLGKRQTGGILIICSTRNINAGEYKGVVTITPFNSELAVQEKKIKLKVYPVKLPDEMPINIFHWDYNIALKPAWLDFLLAGRVNTFHISNLPEPKAPYDFSALKKAVTNIQNQNRGHQFTLILESWFVRERGGWKNEYIPWLNALTVVMAELGLKYDNWYLEVYDETLSPEFLTTAKAIKKINPKIRIFSDCIVKDSNVIDNFTPYVDMWSPYVKHLPPETNEYVKSLERMQASKLPLWTYNCDSQPSQELSLYRIQPWIARMHNLDGCAYWTAKSCEERPAGKFNYGMTYTDDNGNPLASRRWEEWKSGLEDYLLLYVADQKATKIGDKELKQKVKLAISETIANRSSPKLGLVINKWKEILLDSLSK
ncbi:MAG: hypothetical protein WCV67_01985 [Victivallaceae bacterium]|jgi:hypothetical protein